MSLQRGSPVGGTIAAVRKIDIASANPGVADVLTALQVAGSAPETLTSEVVITKPDGTVTTLVVPNADVAPGDRVTIEATQTGPAIRHD